MDSEDKRKQVQRHLRGAAKVRSLEERKRIAREAQERKAQQRERGRARRDWRTYDEDEPFDEFERIGTGARARGKSGGTAGARGAAGLAHDWRVVGLAAGRVRVSKGERVREAHLGGTALAVGPPVVGDEVALQELAGGDARVRSIAERRSVLARRDPGNAHRSKVLAANVDQALITVSAGPAGLRTGLVDRVRIAVEHGGVQPAVVVTKADTLSTEVRARVEDTLAELALEGLECLLTSAVSGEGLDALAALIAQRTTVVVGQSGVGKSTLLNAVDPSHERRTGAVRAGDGKGRHTTTASAMHRLAGGGWLVDTPGIREFGVVEVEPGALLAWFPELERLAARCRRGCAHADDADCVVAEVAAIEPRVARALRSYLRILGDLRPPS